MKLRELSHTLTTEVRPKSSVGRLWLISLGLLYPAVSLSSVLFHVISMRLSLVYALDQAGDPDYLQGYLNHATALLYHIPLATAGVISAVIFFFPDRVGYAISFLALLSSAVIYSRWNSWSKATGGELRTMLSDQSPLGGSVFTKGLALLLAVLLAYETLVLIKVLLSWRKSQ